MIEYSWSRLGAERLRSDSIPKLDTDALYPRCKHRGIAIKIKSLSGSICSLASVNVHYMKVSSFKAAKAESLPVLLSRSRKTRLSCSHCIASCGLILEGKHAVLDIDYDIDIKRRYDFRGLGNSKWYTK